jgi:hypothetical protein
MRRYKELKYNAKTYTEQYKINDILLKEGFQWFLDCEVEEVRIEIRNKTLIFNSGTFFNGTWKYGVFRDGVWKYGIWEGGVWYNGKWFNGIFKSGIIFDGDFEHGKIEGGEIKGGETHNMVIDPSVIDKREKSKKQIQSQEDNTIPQGEKIEENNMKKIISFNDFKINEEGIELQQIEIPTDVTEIPIDKIEIPRDRTRPPVRIYKTMDDYINSKKTSEGLNNMMPMMMASGIADVMMNRTFRHTEDLVDLKNKTVQLSTIKKYCEKNINGWGDFSEDVKSEVLNIITKEFTRDKYEVI